MSRLPFGIVWDSDLWAWLIGDLLRKPMYQVGLGHSTLIPPCDYGSGDRMWGKRRAEILGKDAHT
jgi:hypothetical protein